MMLISLTSWGLIQVCSRFQSSLEERGIFIPSENTFDIAISAWPLHTEHDNYWIKVDLQDSFACRHLLFFIYFYFMQKMVSSSSSQVVASKSCLPWNTSAQFFRTVWMPPHSLFSCDKISLSNIEPTSFSETDPLNDETKNLCMSLRKLTMMNFIRHDFNKLYKKTRKCNYD